MNRGDNLCLLWKIKCTNGSYLFIPPWIHSLWIYSPYDLLWPVRQQPCMFSLPLPGQPRGDLLESERPHRVKLSYPFSQGHPRLVSTNWPTSWTQTTRASPAKTSQFWPTSELPNWLMKSNQWLHSATTFWGGWLRSISLVAQLVKNPPAMWETCVQSLGWENRLEDGMATHSIFLSGESPWTEEPSGLQSMGS